MLNMLATTVKSLGPTIEPGSRPELYVGVDVPAVEGGRVIMAER
jgi:hypothetical protein